MQETPVDMRDGLKAIHPTLMKTTGKPNPDSVGLHNGRWTKLEHENFLIGLALYGREWKKVAAQIKTRTSAQVMVQLCLLFVVVISSHTPVLLTDP
jgi:hypothetical protein